ncbi:MAG: YggS family pyridoxal phosphate-dependent enzyme [Pseudomonadota bacterium]
MGEIRTRIGKALCDAARARDAVDLVAVSKVQPEARVRAVLDAGHRIFGENRVQEAEERWAPLREAYREIELRLIGPLQTNKARAALALFDVIESLDRDKLARKLADEMQAQGRAPRLYVQVNTGEEPQKAGVRPQEADAFIETCRTRYGLSIEGLMVIPPADEPPTPHFALLAALAERNGIEKLSMGMSADFELAIAQGATSVRVGSALFGARDYSAAATAGEGGISE